jgi:hypothetical protein
MLAPDIKSNADSDGCCVLQLSQNMDTMLGLSTTSSLAASSQTIVTDAATTKGKSSTTSDPKLNRKGLAGSSHPKVALDLDSMGTLQDVYGVSASEYELYQALRMEKKRKLDKLQQFFGQALEERMVEGQLKPGTKQNAVRKGGRHGHSKSLSSVEEVYKGQLGGVQLEDSKNWRGTYWRKKKMDKLHEFFGDSVPLQVGKNQFEEEAAECKGNRDRFSSLPTSVKNRLRGNFIKVNRLLGQTMSEEVIDAAVCPALLEGDVPEIPVSVLVEERFPLHDKVETPLLKAQAMEKFQKMRQMLGDDAVSYEMVFRQSVKPGAVKLGNADRQLLRRRFDKLTNLLGQALDQTTFYQDVVVPAAHHLSTPPQDLATSAFDLSPTQQTFSENLPPQILVSHIRRSNSCHSFRHRQRNFSKLVKHLGSDIPSDEIHASTSTGTTASTSSFSQHAAKRSSRKIFRTFGGLPPEPILTSTVSVKSMDEVKLSSPVYEHYHAVSEELIYSPMPLLPDIDASNGNHERKWKMMHKLNRFFGKLPPLQ